MHPSQNRIPGSLVLNRENQRRSRARHREFVSDLQRRVHEYERRDAQATLEMQQVARAVAAENQALREMLAARNVTSEELEAYLMSRNVGIAQKSTFHIRSGRPLTSTRAAGSFSSRLLRNAVEQSVFSEQLSESSTAALSSQSPENTGPTSSRWPPANSATQDRRISSQPSPQESRRHNYEQPAHEYQARGSETHATCACDGEPGVDDISSHMPLIDPACYCPPELPRRSLLASNYMPCLEAAIILAQLRGQSDSTLAQAALGCAETTSCLVQNIDLLRLMDEMF